MPVNHPIPWRLVVGLATLWIGGENALNHRWSRYTHGSLSGAQYSLLISFWAISQWNWANRTVSLIAGLAALTLVRVAIMFPLTNGYDSPVNILWDLLLNQTNAFIGEALVLAVEL